MGRKKQIFIYVISDYIAATIVWGLFFLFRKLFIEWLPPNYSILGFIENKTFFLGIIIVPVFWIIIHYISGYYRFIFRKTFPEDFIKTLKISVIGVIILFFTLLLNDIVKNYHTYYITGSVLLGLQFIITLIPRLFITKLNIRKIRKRKRFFNTILIGSGPCAVKIYKELSDKKPTDGNKFLGFIKNPSAKNLDLENYVPDLGNLENLPEIINTYNIDEIIIAIPQEEQNDLLEIINWMGYSEITVKAIPGMNNILKGKVKLTNLLGTPLIEINHELMSFKEQAFKQFIDLFSALLSLIILSPVILFCIIGIKLTSKGPILHRQERIGKNGKPFMLFKFRSMYLDAEKYGPNLTSRFDERITSFGKLLRRTKFDEIPNFINVLKGDMSLVGPRPERKYYIDQIIKKSPHYLKLQKIKPGITSLGQVRFGYAENVEQMTRRLRYDLIYMENMSLATDFTIIYYTFLLLFKGRHV